MSTRASIRFKDRYDTFYVYRHSDGYPDGDILPDLRNAVEKASGRWSGSELGTMVAFFLGTVFDPHKRLPSYALTSSIHGDESYHYVVNWDEAKREYVIGYDEENDD